MKTYSVLIASLLLSSVSFASEAIRCDGQEVEGSSSATMFLAAKGNQQLSPRLTKAPFEMTLVEDRKVVRKATVLLAWESSDANGNPDRYTISSENGLTEGLIVADGMGQAFLVTYAPYRSYSFKCERE